MMINGIDISPIQHLYPFKSHFLNIDGHKLHYIDEGPKDRDASPIIMLHGNGTWSFYFRDLIRRFSKTHRVIVPDHIGFGLSDKPQNYKYELFNHIRNLQRFITFLELESFSMMVHDWGGPIGMGYAIKNPDRVNRLIILNTAAFLEDGLKLPFMIKLCQYPIIGDLIVRRLNLLTKWGLKKATVRQLHLPEDVKRGYLLPYQTYANRVGLLGFIKDIPWHTHMKSFAILQDITNNLILFKHHPKIIIWGEQDFCFTEEFLERWQMHFPDAKVKTISNAGHLVVEDAADIITPWIDAFLRETPTTL